MEIITQSPSWFILLCLLAGAVYAGALYFRDKFNRTYGSKLAAVLGTLRFIAVSLLAFFLLRPLIKTVTRDVEKPLIIIAQDNSESLSIAKENNNWKSEYLSQLEQLQNAFGEDYEVRLLSFGQEVKDSPDSINFDEKLTDFSNLYAELSNKFSGRNIGALIVASDGLYTKGSSPLYASANFKAPTYTIALGDTSVYRDVLIAEVAANRLAYLNNKFPIEITVEGRKAKGESAVLTVSNKGNVVYTQPISFANDRYFQTVQLLQDAKTVGLQKYTVSISTIKNEITTVNNVRDVFIEVLDSRQKVLILASAPHPDLQALREAISSNDAYNIDVELTSKFTKNISEYNLVIFHQLPASGGVGMNFVKTALDKNIPSLFIWGANADFNAFNSLELGFSLSNYRNSNTEVSGNVSQEFSLFKLDQTKPEALSNFPPLSIPFGDFKYSPGVQTFISQQVGQIKTEKPLVAFNKKGDTKVGLVAGEGIWRWRIASFRQFQNHDFFNEIATKTVQYMAAKEDKSLFRINGKNNFLENEAITFDAELYNEAYEFIADRDISMVIKNESGAEYNFAFSSTNGRYKLNAGNLSPGNYTYIASTLNGGQTLKKSGEFSISPIQLELVNTVADHRLLYQLAEENGGKMYDLQNMNKLAEAIKSREDVASISYETKNLNDLIQFKWILFLLIALLGGEWLLRKRAGTY